MNYSQAIGVDQQRILREKEPRLLILTPHLIIHLYELIRLSKQIMQRRTASPVSGLRGLFSLVPERSREG